MDTQIKNLLCLFLAVIMGFAGTYYFIKEEDTGTQSPSGVNPPAITTELVEIESDSMPQTPPGFRPTTVDEIHSKGLLTPSESFTLAQQQGSVDEGTAEGYSYASWISTRTQGGVKYVDGGSRTGRTWIPGRLFLMARNACLADNNPNIVFLRKLFKPDSTYYQTWGYNTQWVANREYPVGTTAAWHQRGWHKYSSSQNPYVTNVIKQY